MVGNRVWIVVVASLVSAASFAQGGFGGGGMGGGAAAGQGGRQGRTGNLEGEEVSLNHILTPGDRGEWPFWAREGETFIFSASSTVFDPAIEIVDPAGKVLATNDDVKTGDQTALVMIRFPKAGAFKVLVKAFKSSGGGLYKFTSRRFLSTDLNVGTRTAGSVGKSGTQWLRLPAKAADTMVVTARANSFRPNLEVYAPSGEKVSESQRSVSDQVTRFVFRAPTAGDYYVRLGEGNPQSSFAMTAAIARVASTKIGAAPAKQTMEPGGLDIWTFEGKKGDLVRIAAQAPGRGVNADLDVVPVETKPGEETAAEVEEPLRYLVGDEKGSGSIVALLMRDGKFQVTVSQARDARTEYTLSVQEGAEPWQEGQSLTKTLKIGTSNYYTFEGTRGQIVRLEGAAEQFDLQMELLDPSGERLAFNDDGQGQLNPLITALLITPGRYIVRVNSYGFGGSGSYTLKRSPSPIRPLALGAKGDGAVGLGGKDIWSIQGKAGQTVLISVRSQEFDTAFTVYGPDSLELAFNDDGGNGTDSLVSVTLPTDGVYTIWVTGREGSGKYTVRWIDLDR